MTKDTSIIRFDFKLSKLKIINDQTSEIEFEMIPDPERYERMEVNGEKGWFDKYDNTFFPDFLLKDLASQAIGIPMYAHFPKIENLEKYLQQRREIISDAFDRPSEKYLFQDKSEELLQQLGDDKQYFVIIVGDLVGSTKLSQKLSPEENAQVISLFSKEVAILAPLFHCFVLKYMGDGVILYLPEPNIIGKADLAMDVALTLRRVVLDVINPELQNRGLPSLGIRIGIDAGEAVVTSIGSIESKSHKDIIGETVNLAAKIESKAETNMIIVGEICALATHTQWRKHLVQYQPSTDWSYIDRRTGEAYKLYMLNL